MDENSLYKKVRYVFSSCWVDPSVRYHLPEFERHINFGQLQCNVFSTFREANGKRQSLIRYILFLYYTGCKLVRSLRTISTTLPEKTSHQIVTLSWLLKKNWPRIKYRKLHCVISFSAGYVFHSSPRLSIVVKEQKQFRPTHVALFSSPLRTA